MFGVINQGNKHINQPAGKIITGEKKIEQETRSEPSEQFASGNNSEGINDFNRLSAFAQANKKKEDTGGLIEESVMEQTIDPSLLKSDDEAWKKGVEKYLYNTDRTWEDVYPFSKNNEEKLQPKMDEWQKGMAEYRARWD